MGGSLGKSEQQSQAQSTSTAGQDVWGPQTPFLQQLYGQGQTLSQDPAYAQAAGQLSGQVTDPLLSSFGQAFGPESLTGQAAAGLTDPLISGLTGILGRTGDPSGAFAAGGSNPLLDKNVAMALEQASQNFARNVAPNIEREAIAQGQFGGTRGDLALGTAAADVNRDALAAAMGAYQQQYAGDRAANLLSQGQLGETQLGASQQILNLLGGQGANVGQGVAAGQGLFNLGMGGQQAQWDPLLAQSALLGGPLVLGSSESQGTSAGDASSWGVGFTL